VKVSVLVPVYNGETFLAECLESILAQDFADMEILISDDASTDGSVALVERYASRDSRIRWWKNPNNLGLARNFNCCLRAAKGEYIKYVLQDDKLISPLAIQKMTEVLDHHPGVSLVSSASQVLDEHSRVIKVRKHFKPGIMEGREVIGRCVERLTNLIGEPSVVMFRREQAARGYNEQFRQLLDLDLWFHLLEQGGLAYLAEPLCAFRRHAAQQSEFNRLNHISQREHFFMFKTYFDKHYGVSRRALFIFIYYLNKNPQDEQTPRLIADLMVLLKPGWYLLYWLERKITRPFENLKNWLVKKRHRRLYRRELPISN
jgi:glycosyltransferase involved in cell wall biosynthesis